MIILLRITIRFQQIIIVLSKQPASAVMRFCFATTFEYYNITTSLNVLTFMYNVYYSILLPFIHISDMSYRKSAYGVVVIAF